ncbi:MAG TPA: sugar phosphate nucleotidyltransferase, partial [Paracoccaceae bacterium]|nr:sugar phosphate nucleotidyltransferase [Paracoccaceae bacterium]
MSERGMPIETIHPVILCGGSGTRLWPLSRQSYPKQFARVFGATSPFQETVERLAASGFAPPVVVTGAEFRFVVAEQFGEIGRAAGRILIEPAARNTGPAILAAAMFLAKEDPEALLLVCPSDHVIADGAAFRAAVQAGMAAAREGRLVTFGIVPTRPETGFGYL